MEAMGVGLLALPPDFTRAALRKPRICSRIAEASLPRVLLPQMARTWVDGRAERYLSAFPPRPFHTLTMLAPSHASVRVQELEVGLDSELMRILVVDDNPAIHDDFKKILSPAAGAGPKLERLELELFGELGTQASLKPPDPGTSRGFSISSALQGERA